MRIRSFAIFSLTLLLLMAMSLSASAALVAYYDFSETSGLPIDKSPSGIVPTMSGSATLGNAGMPELGNALTCTDTENMKLIIPLASTTVPTGSFTLSYWHKVDAATVATQFMQGMLYGNWVKANGGYTLMITKAGGGWGPRFESPETAGSLVTGTWKHITIVFNSTTKYASWYSGGVMLSHKYMDQARAGNSFNFLQSGQLDDIAVWDKCLDTASIAALANKTKTPLDAITEATPDPTPWPTPPAEPTTAPTPGTGVILSDDFNDTVVNQPIASRYNNNALGGTLKRLYLPSQPANKIVAAPNGTNAFFFNEAGFYLGNMGLLNDTTYSLKVDLVEIQAWGVVRVEGTDAIPVWGPGGMWLQISMGWVTPYSWKSGNGWTAVGPQALFTAGDLNANGSIPLTMMYNHIDRSAASLGNMRVYASGRLIMNYSGIPLDPTGSSVGCGGAAAKMTIDNLVLTQNAVSPTPSPTPTPTPTPTATPTPIAGNVVLFSDTFETGVVGETLDGKDLGNQLGGVMTQKWVGATPSTVKYAANPHGGIAGCATGGYSVATAEFVANPDNGYVLEATLPPGGDNTFNNLFFYHVPKAKALWTDAGLICRFVHRTTQTLVTNSYVDVLYRNTKNLNVATPAMRGSTLLVAADYDANGSVPVKWYISYVDITTTSTVSGTVYTNGNKKFDFTTGNTANYQMSPCGQSAGFMNPYGVGYVDDFKLSQVSPSPTPTATPTPYPEQAGKAGILFVTSTNPPIPQDAIILQEMTRLGYPVTVKVPEDLANAKNVEKACELKGLIVVSQSVSSAAIGGKFLNIAVPFMTFHDGLYDDMGMTDAVKASGSVTGDSITIAAPGNALAAGLTGSVKVYDVKSFVTWGYPGPSAVTVATYNDVATSATIFYYDKGASLVNGMPAPARRIGFFMRANTADFQTADAWKLFDEAINWGVVAPTPTPTPTPVPVDPSVTPIADIIFVDGAVTTSGDGTTWAKAFKTIGAALATTSSHPTGAHVWVKEGTYAEGNLRLWQNWGLFGGFDGTENPGYFRLAKRNLAANPTIIDAVGKAHGLIIAQPYATAQVTMYVDGLTIKNADAVANGPTTVIPNIPGVPESDPANPGYCFNVRGGGIMAYGAPALGAPRDASPKPDGAIVPIVKIRNVKIDNCNGAVGGGAQLDRMIFLVDDSEFTNNHCTVSGGGVTDTAIDQGTSVFTNCLFANNDSDSGWSGGAGAWSFESNGRYIACQFINNTAATGANSLGGGLGGTMMRGNYGLVAINCVFSGNSADKGAAIFAGDQTGAGAITAINCTFAGNTAKVGGAAMFANQGSKITAINNIISGNTATAGAIVEGDAVVAASTMDHNLMNGNTGNATANITPTNPIAGDPKFVGTSFLLQSTSPAINAGATVTDVTPLVDIEGVVRDSQVDLGAYEYVYVPTIFVDAAKADDSGDGLTWGTAKKSIGAAIVAAAGSDSASTKTIWVKAGTYNEGMLRISKAIYGGFAGGEVPGRYDLDKRDFVANASIIDGSTAIAGQPAPHVIFVWHQLGMGTDLTYEIDGFTIQGGDSKTTETGILVESSFTVKGPNTGRAGGMIIFQDVASDADPDEKPVASVANCIFKNNKAASYGGAAWFDRMEVNITDCVFDGNTGSGGGAVVNASCNRGPITFTRCIFKNNTSTATNPAWQGGGATFDFWTDATYSRCVFDNNVTGTVGGALWATGGANTVAVNCLIANNTAALGGGAYAFFDYLVSSVSFLNCTVANNNGGTGTGAAITAQNCTATNTIFSGNSITGATGYAIDATVAGTLDYCLMNANTATAGALGATVASTSELSGDPKFVSTSDFHLQDDSPAVGAGRGFNAPEEDLDGVPRFQPIDIGCYQIYVGGHPLAADSAWLLY